MRSAKLAVLALLACSAALALSGCSDEPAEVTADLESLGREVGVVEVGAEVPNVVGLPSHDAAKTLTEDGFDSPAFTEVFSVEPTGTVVAQNPPGGTRLPVGSVVELYFSRGQDPESR